MKLFNVEYFVDGGFSGFWFGTGFGAYDGDVGREGTNQKGDYEIVRIGINMGYTKKVIQNIYFNLWGGVYFPIIGDKTTNVAGSVLHWDSAYPLLSFDLGWHY